MSEKQNPEFVEGIPQGIVLILLLKQGLHDMDNISFFDIYVTYLDSDTVSNFKCSSSGN